MASRRIEAAAQKAAESLVAAGIRGILNFAPTTLTMPDEISVRNVNLAIELEGLSYAINEAEAAKREAEGPDGMDSPERSTEQT